MTLSGGEFHRHGGSLRPTAGGRGPVLPTHDRTTAPSQRLSAERHRHQAWNVETERTLLHTDHRRRRPVQRAFNRPDTRIYMHTYIHTY